MARLTSAERAKLPDRAFAYVDPQGKRKLPIHDESHVRNALARFDQVHFASPAARERARTRLLQAAKKHGIVPIGFITSELRREDQGSSQPDNLPDGTVALLFTDIEGSTPLLRELGNEYEPVLGAVRDTIAGSVEAAGGALVEVRADETFSVFTDPVACVKCAIAVQREMGDEFAARNVRVRIGIHTGSVRLTSNGYIGLAVHKAARVSAAAHGAQIVVSSETKNAVGDVEGSSFGFRSLGLHHLAGLPRRHRLYQIEADGLEADFAALRTNARGERSGGSGI